MFNVYSTDNLTGVEIIRRMSVVLAPFIGASHSMRPSRLVTGSSISLNAGPLAAIA